MAHRSLVTFKLQRVEGDDQYWRNKAAFELHQAGEQLYHCALLVLPLYSPKLHKLNFLRSHAMRVTRRNTRSMTKNCVGSWSGLPFYRRWCAVRATDVLANGMRLSSCLLECQPGVENTVGTARRYL